MCLSKIIYLDKRYLGYLVKGGEIFGTHCRQSVTDSSDFGSLHGESLGAIRIMTKLTSGQVKCSGKMERMGALWPGSAGFESQLCHLAACTSSLT